MKKVSKILVFFREDFTTDFTDFTDGKWNPLIREIREIPGKNPHFNQIFSSPLFPMERACAPPAKRSVALGADSGLDGGIGIH
jgi:hypothetical protein